ncbi:MAG TPA: B12-binding domain-containing protein [Aromatoleum sp.]|uniref:cobalamin B12-binding domain-containing protein n=1 Tax=Aromatoleum sp. TaxID=2307007 RepID=UPI002B492503|nr:B12-binding domain-containing protein [Aromatoleum sp.]HJV25832.1 B12-binding domain-containing protein [Aromatoleum sp.]
MDALITPFRDALVTLDRNGAERIFQQALASQSPLAAVEQLVVPALELIGQDWHEGNIALSQVYMSGRACVELVERVLPPGDPARKNPLPSAIVVLNDNHMLGKRIVYSVMRASGHPLLDYGRLDVERLVERALADKIRVLLISVLILPSALKIKEVCARLKASGADVRVLVGGAPFLFDDQLWQEVGADAVGYSAAEAVAIVDRWMDEMQ